MKIYEYAHNRGIKSRDVVKKLHELGFTHIKNHLSLVPQKVIDVLDETDFEIKNKKIIKEVKNIAFISMECSPFISKGLGDMVKNKVVQYNLAGNKLVVILPLYKLNKNDLEFIIDISVLVNKKIYKGKVYKYQNQNVDYYFIDNEYYYNRDKLYGFYDDCERFAFLNKGSIELLKYLQLSLNIINLHDWPLGLFPLLFKEIKDDYPHTIIEFSAYGATYQGIYGVEVLTDIFNLSLKYFEDGTCEYAKSVNFLKTALVTADKVDINKVALNDLKNSYLKDYVYDNM